VRRKLALVDHHLSKCDNSLPFFLRDDSRYQDARLSRLKTELFGHRQLQDVKLVLDDRAIKKTSAG